MRRRFAVLALGFALSGCGDGTGPSSGVPFVSVSAGDAFTCALRADGSAWCWGTSLFGQVGDSATTQRSSAVAVATTLRFRSIEAGSDHVCGVATDSTAWCWGLNDFLELGNPGTTFCNPSIRFVSCADAPIRVTGGLKFDSLSVGGYATCGLVRDPAAVAGTHRAWCWGWNTHGELGSGFIGDIIDEPTAITGTTTFTTVSLDLYHACGVDGLGSLYCWGSNIYGQLGADTIRTPRCDSGPAFGLFCAPAPILAAIGSFTSIVSTGGNHTCALDAGGAAWCWGSAQEGTLGSTGATGGSTPSAVSGSRTYRAITSGDSHSCALTGSGQAWCWGINDAGQLGSVAPADLCPAFGTARPCNRAPVTVAGLPELTRISAGHGHTCGVSRRGDVWCWGRGTEGQLGDGQASSSPVPVRVVVAEGT